MMQADIFLESEGNEWYKRNKDKNYVMENDKVLELLLRNRIAPKSVLEYGCSDGRRLIQIKTIYNASAVGIEPSGSAVKNCLVECVRGDCRTTINRKFDVVIYGFCLYLVDRQSLGLVAKIARQTANPWVIIWDFYPDLPFTCEYRHRPGMFSYHDKHDIYFLNYFDPIDKIETYCGDVCDGNKCAAILLKKNNRVCR